MGIFDKFKKQEVKPATVMQKVEDHGGMTEEQLKIEQKKEVEAILSTFTPREKAALEFLQTSKFVSFKSKFQEDQLNKKRLEYAKEFAKNPREKMPSVKYNESTGKFETPGKMAGAGSAVA